MRIDIGFLIFRIKGSVTEYKCLFTAFCLCTVGTFLISAACKQTCAYTECCQKGHCLFELFCLHFFAPPLLIFCVHCGDPANPSTHHVSKFCCGRLRSKSKKGQTGKLHHHRTDIKHRCYQNRSCNIRQDMAPDHLRKSTPRKLTGRHIVCIFYRQGLASCNSGIFGPADHRQRQNRIADSSI